MTDQSREELDRRIIDVLAEFGDDFVPSTTVWNRVGVSTRLTLVNGALRRLVKRGVVELAPIALNRWRYYYRLADRGGDDE